MHKLLIDSPGEKMLLLGNEAIARGAIEAGVAVGTTYPGTPSSEISLNFFQMSQESDLYFEYSTNEKVALEVAAATANCRRAHHVHHEARGRQRGRRRPHDPGLRRGQGRPGHRQRRRPLHVFQPERAGQPLLRQAVRAADSGALVGGRSQGNGRIRLRPFRKASGTGHFQDHHPDQPFHRHRDPGRDQPPARPPATSAKTRSTT